MSNSSDAEIKLLSANGKEMNLETWEEERLAASRPQISVVVPLFEEAENVRPLYENLRSAMDELGRTWEVVFVDDGSTDDTYRLLKQLHLKYDGVRVVSFRRNFGQTAAMVAGFDYSRGDTIIALDGDLQNNPKDIRSLLAKLEEGYDVVSGWRVNRQEGFWLRRLPSRIANWLISKTTGTHLHDYGCTLKAYRAETIKELHLYGEMHRFIPALLGGDGARVCEVPVSHSPRLNGKSKYGISRTIRVFLDLLMVKFFLSFLTKPLQIFGLVGLLTFLPGSAICTCLLIARLFFDRSLADRPLFSLGILLTVVGVQFISMGLLAEIQIRTYHESSNKRTYKIREILEHS